MTSRLALALLVCACGAPTLQHELRPVHRADGGAPSHQDAGASDGGADAGTTTPDAGPHQEPDAGQEDAGSPDAGRVLVDFEPGEASPAGTATIPTRSVAALKQSVFTTSTVWRSRFTLGRALFEVPWQIAPGAQPERDGLGPLFHADACLSCHPGNGRGAVEAGTIAPAPVLLRISLHDEPIPGLGAQLQPRAIPGVAAEGTVSVTSVSEEVDDAWLTRAVVTVSPALPEGAQLSLRISPGLSGLGLLEAVTDDELALWADETDADQDGISGRLAVLPDGRVGRFGWKALHPTIVSQTAGALLEDMGLTNPVFDEGPCVSGQTACLAAPHGGAPEVPQAAFEDLAFYTRLLGIPARVDADSADTLAGKQLFHDVGCHRCHRPSLRTAATAQPVELANQTVWPYSDLLLHDLGEGLADGRSEGAANGREWRTPPLWALSLSTQTVTGRVGYLHDGRARTLDEAVRWHGGEATDVVRAYRALSPEERATLLRFVESL